VVLFAEIQAGYLEWWDWANCYWSVGIDRLHCLLSIYLI